MAQFTFKLPDLGEGAVQAEIVQWHVQAGDKVAKDQPLVEMLTEKASIEIGAPASGTIVSLNGGPGDSVRVGAELAVFEIDGPIENNDAPPISITNETAQVRPVENNENGAAIAPSPNRPLASPAVRRRAREAGVNLHEVRGSGPEGRIRHEDLDEFIHGRGAASPTGGDTTMKEIRVIGLRRKIAEHMQRAAQRIPHITYVEEVDVTELESLRDHLNSHAQGEQPKLTLLPFIVRALVIALREHPEFSACFDDDAGIIRQYAAAHVGIATQTSKGLLVPVLKHAETRNLWDCAVEIARLAEAARAGKVAADELSGGTITISNLGALGGIVSTPIINSPEIAIIGVNKIAVRAEFRDGIVVPRKMMNLSSSFDHRIIDGWRAAEFIQQIKTVLEWPAFLEIGTFR